MMTRIELFSFYAALIIILALVGYFMGKEYGMGKQYAMYGAVIALIISVVGWFTYGKTHSY